MKIYKTEYNKECTSIHNYIHMILGGILAIKKIPKNYRIILFYIILIYQFSQLIFNVRYFFNKNKLLKGNCLKHTLNKLFDFILGYSIVFFIFNSK